MGNALCCIDDKKKQYYSSAPGDGNQEDIEDIRLRHGGLVEFRKDTIMKYPKTQRSGDRTSELSHHDTGDQSSSVKFQVLNYISQGDLEQGITQANLQKSPEKKPQVIVGGVPNLLDFDTQEQNEPKLIEAASPPSNSIISTSYQPITEDLPSMYYLPNSLGIDEEMEELAQLRNQNELDIVFVIIITQLIEIQSKRGIIEHIESMFAEVSLDSDDKKKTWDLKLDKPEIKCFVKKSGGSRFNADQPYIMTEMLFNSAFSLNKIIEAIFEPKNRQQWDKTVLKSSSKAIGQCITMNYQQNRGVLAMNNREFLEKQIRFADSKSGKFYIYYSFAPDGCEYDKIETPPKTDRAYTIVGVQTLHRRAEDGKIVYSLLMQCDLKMKITPKLIAMFLPTGMHDWHQKCTKFINNNYDRI